MHCICRKDRKEGIEILCALPPTDVGVENNIRDERSGCGPSSCVEFAKYGHHSYSPRRCSARAYIHTYIKGGLRISAFRTNEIERVISCRSPLLLLAISEMGVENLNTVSPSQQPSRAKIKGAMLD